MIELIKYFILGLLQGLTEFFPISSSGHVELYKYIAQVADEHPLLLIITIHFATALSTIVVYRQKIKHILLGTINKNQQDIDFVLKLLVSTVPIIIIYFFLKHNIDNVFDNASYLVSIMLIITGIILIISSIFKNAKYEISFKYAFLMGLAQALAILPGISRSGSTISMALCCGVKRSQAAEFSFLMGLAPIIGGAIIHIMEFGSVSDINNMEIQGLIIAFLTAFISGLFACKYMIHIVKNNNLKYFGYYCILIGLAFLLYFLQLNYIAILIILVCKFFCLLIFDNLIRFKKNKL